MCRIEIFPLQYYTKSGNLKPPPVFYICLLFLARTWVLLVISTVSRNSGSQLLALFYPDRYHFYIGLVSGFIAIILFALSGRDHDKYPYISNLWQLGYFFFMFSIIVDVALQLYFLSLHHFQYSLEASIQLVAIIWILIYSLNSKHLKMCFVRSR